MDKERIDIIDENNVAERAKAFFMQGYNCSQSVAMAFSSLYDIPESLMARFAASFGGGIGRMRETCGTACAMFMLAGLEVQDTADNALAVDYSSNPYPSQELKGKNYEVVQRLAAEFRKQAGSLVCAELLGLNQQRADGTIPEIRIVSTPEARTDEYYKTRPCLRMVETAARIYVRYLKGKA